jgi:hypothetical protein
MAKVVTMRERVHQPFYDSLIRTAGLITGTVGDTNQLFASGGVRTEATTNLPTGNVLPSDQSHVTLALRCFVWYRNPILRVNGAVAGEVAGNGDYGLLTPFLTGGGSVGNAPASVQDYYRLIWQTEEQLHWSFGTGLKNSIINMPTWYFPAGGGISGDMGGTTDLIHWQNSGWDGHQGILRLARAILLPPRQNLQCTASIFGLNADGQALAFGTSQGTRNMLSLRDNLNAPDAMPKIIQFCFDGLFSRDVQ